jgi:hypothetical protein
MRLPSDSRHEQDTKERRWEDVSEKVWSEYGDAETPTEPYT